MDEMLYSSTYNAFAKSFHIENDWMCCFCNNHNHPSFINSKLTTQIEICTLCGLSLQASIKMALKGNQFRFVKTESWYDALNKKKQHYKNTIDQDTDHSIMKKKMVMMMMMMMSLKMNGVI